MEILLIRHGETRWNRELVFRGRRDIPLSERGQKQAELLAKRLKGLKINALFSSPLGRATNTAIPAARKLKLDLDYEDALIDVDFGFWTGLSRDQVKEKYPQEYEMWHSDPVDMSFEAGEAMREVQHRCSTWLIEMAAEEYGRIVVVTHRVILKLMFLSVLQAPGTAFWQIRFDTCSVSSLEVDKGKFYINYLNDTQHLGRLAAEKLPDF